MNRLIVAALFVINAVMTAINIDMERYGWAALTGAAALFTLAIIASGEV